LLSSFESYDFFLCLTR